MGETGGETTGKAGGTEENGGGKPQGKMGGGGEQEENGGVGNGRETGQIIIKSEDKKGETREIMGEETGGKASLGAQGYSGLFSGGLGAFQVFPGFLGCLGALGVFWGGFLEGLGCFGDILMLSDVLRVILENFGMFSGWFWSILFFRMFSRCFRGILGVFRLFLRILGAFHNVFGAFWSVWRVCGVFLGGFGCFWGISGVFRVCEVFLG